MALSQDQISELKKFQKILSQLEKILNVSNNEDQKKRVNKDIQKFKNRILMISPNGIPDAIQSFSRAETSDEDSTEIKHRRTLKSTQAVFDNLVVMRISPHSSDPEINFLSTVINLMEVEYLPILSDAHIKFDFSHISERNTVLKQFENIKRTVKVLIETIEEYASSDKQEFKEQMGRMKNKQSRVFTSEASELFKSTKAFLDKTLNDLSHGENIINNIDETIKFNPKTELGTLMQGKQISEALESFSTFLEIALDNISVPK